MVEAGGAGAQGYFWRLASLKTVWSTCPLSKNNKIRDSSLGQDACHQDLGPDFYPQDPHGGTRSHLISTACCNGVLVYTHTLNKCVFFFFLSVVSFLFSLKQHQKASKWGKKVYYKLTYLLYVIKLKKDRV